MSYIRASGQIQFIMPIAEHFGRIPLTKIDQAAVDEAALKLFPGAKYSPATRNRQVYCVVSAILKHAGIEKRLKRPKSICRHLQQMHAEPAHRPCADGLVVGSLGDVEDGISTGQVPGIARAVLSAASGDRSCMPGAEMTEETSVGAPR